MIETMPSPGAADRHHVAGREHRDHAVVSVLLWWLAITQDWLDEVSFVSNVSMLALVFAGVSGVAAGRGGDPCAGAHG